MTQWQDQSAMQTESTQASRLEFVTLYCYGSPNDAKAMYGAFPGATDAGWQALERMLAPVKQFIVDGGMPYYVPLVTSEYQGVPTPGPEDPELPEVPPDGDGSDLNRTSQIAPGVATSGPQDQASQKTVSAQELIDRAKAAKTVEELDEIEALANGRVTVLDAVAAREDELTKA